MKGKYKEFKKVIKHKRIKITHIITHDPFNATIIYEELIPLN